MNRFTGLDLNKLVYGYCAWPMSSWMSFPNFSTKLFEVLIIHRTRCAAYCEEIGFYYE